MNLDKSYPHMFELLWYSQLPCFDIVNVTTKASEDHGKELGYVFEHHLEQCHFDQFIRYDQGVLVERQEVELFKHIH